MCMCQTENREWGDYVIEWNARVPKVGTCWKDRTNCCQLEAWTECCPICFSNKKKKYPVLCEIYTYVGYEFNYILNALSIFQVTLTFLSQSEPMSLSVQHSRPFSGMMCRAPRQSNNAIEQTSPKGRDSKQQFFLNVSWGGGLSVWFLAINNFLNL